VKVALLRFTENWGKRLEEWGVRHWWFTPVILAIQEAEIRRIMVQRQPGQMAHKILPQKNPTPKQDWRSACLANVGP
jgi:hypothetical protein